MSDLKEKGTSYAKGVGVCVCGERGWEGAVRVVII